jgi:radical SAM-linked protein
MIRSGWPLKLSSGYNPRVKMSFTPSLSLGYSSNAEYIDVTLKCELNDSQIEHFKGSLVAGVNVEYVCALRPSEPGLNEHLAGFRYRVDLEEHKNVLENTLGNIIERGKNYIILDVFKENGGFKNPKKILGEGRYKITKIKCHWNDN